ncbi:MAG: LLM class flavin-dependent oxidoreductase [Microbacteriaceae bacterium]|nr:MAG: LLM class flavin-dependent oxidoreductase [Microbacteriaceae bacterium]
MSSHLILGAMFRALGAFPSGWRYPGAHNNPLRDPLVLRKTARLAEAAKFDFVFFGDWPSTGLELAYTDPHLVAHLEPLSAIGLIATVNTIYSDPYTLARQSASIDLLSGGRAGLNIVAGADPRADANHGRDARRAYEHGGSKHGGDERQGSENWGNQHRYGHATEFVDVLRLLWDSWEDDAFVRNRASGTLIDPARLYSADYRGEYVSVAGPLNVIRPVQGQLPIMHAGRSPHSRELVTDVADLALVALNSLPDALEFSSELRRQAASVGRDPATLKIITPVLPIVAETTKQAQDIFDTLLELVPLEGDAAGVGAISGAGAASAGFPVNRSLRALGAAVGVPLRAASLDVELPPSTTARFSEYGQQLLEFVAVNTGRMLGGARPVTYRHLLAAHVAPASAVIVGDAKQVADHFDAWFGSGAVDGFNVLSAFMGGQFAAFTGLVVPELRRRGLFRTEYVGSTLREHLGLPRPQNLHVAAREGADVWDAHHVTA